MLLLMQLTAQTHWIGRGNVHSNIMAVGFLTDLTLGRGKMNKIKLGLSHLRYSHFQGLGDLNERCHCGLY